MIWWFGVCAISALAGWALRAVLFPHDSRTADEQRRIGFTAGYQCAWAESVNDRGAFLRNNGMPPEWRSGR